jgi:hypothetical protein
LVSVLVLSSAATDLVLVFKTHFGFSSVRGQVSLLSIFCSVW